MVEQEYSQASPVFSDLQKSDTRYQNAFSNPCFIINSTTLINEPLCSSDVDNDIAEINICPLQEDLPEKEFLFVDSSFADPCSELPDINNVDGSWHPLSETLSTTNDPYFEVNSPLSFWGVCPIDLEAMKMDDVFQVDKDDLVQSPTLAELNANDESLFDSFDCFDSYFPTGNKTLNKPLSIPDMNSESAFNNIDQSKHVTSENTIMEKESELALKEEPSFIKQFMKTESDKRNLKLREKPFQNDIKFQTVPISIGNMDNQEPHKPVNTKGLKNDSEDEVSSLELDEEKSLQPICQLNNSLTNDNFDSDDDSDMDGEFSSDADEDSEDEGKATLKHGSPNMSNLEKKRSRYFWQYNMQSKGPKGPKMKLTGKSINVHDLPGVADPVFSANCPIAGVKHSGKARRGDGNDLTPNPRKLYNIGIELEKLNNLIDGLIPVNELPVNARTKSRKEKNKLASRACRLKKKAQHEANKLKLFGLHQEQKYLLSSLNEIKKLVKNKINNFKQLKNESILSTIESLKLKKSTTRRERPIFIGTRVVVHAITKVAGCSTDFVNNVLKSVALGNDSGGLNISSKHGIYA